MNINKRKTEIQNKIVEKTKNIKAVCLEFSTGVGKSLAALKMVDQLREKNPKIKGYIICKEITHKENWRKEIDKQNMNHLLDHIEMFLYASLHKKKDNIVDFIIMDECHAITMKRAMYLKTIVGKNTKLIFLSATLNSEKKYLMSLIQSDIKYYTISLKKAIELSLIPEPKVFIHNVFLNNDDNRKYVFQMKKGDPKKRSQASCMFHERWNIFNQYKHVELNVSCNEFEYYQLITGQINYYTSMATTDHDYKKRINGKNMMLFLSTERKRFIANTKTEKAKEIINEFRRNKKRFICFTGSIHQVDELGKKGAVHYKNKKNENQILIDCFNNQECDEIFVVKMLRESINLTNIEKGLIVQLDGTMISFYQMLGRCLRHQYPELHMIVMRNTVDENWFKIAMRGFDKKYITQIKE